MSQTTNLALPHILAAQAQKHVTHNEALQVLDALVQLAVLDRDRTEPPASPDEGDRHLVAAGATGDWERRSGQIAAWQDGAWRFLAPNDGWIAFVAKERVLIVYQDQDWTVPALSGGGTGAFESLGIGTRADAQNAFAAKLGSALWTARSEAEGGSGSLRTVMNKEASGKILSLVFQSGFSGRAEVGLVGGDDLSVKVSADGAAWTEAIRVDRTSGRVAFPRTNVLTDFAVSLLPDSGRFSGNAANGIVVGAFAFPSYLSLISGATATDGGRYVSDNSDYGGAGAALAPAVRDLVDMIRAPHVRRYGVEFRVAQITMGSLSTSAVVTVEGAPYHLGLLMAFGPRAPRMTFHLYVRALDGPILYRHYAGQTIVKNGVPHRAHVLVRPNEGWVSITVFDEQDPHISIGYNPTPLNIHGAATGHRFLVACPALLPGITAVDERVGVVAGINRWLG